MIKRLTWVAPLLCLASAVAQSSPCYAENDQDDTIVGFFAGFSSLEQRSAFPIWLPAPRQVWAARIYTGNQFRTGGSAIEIWSDDPILAQPKARLGGGTWQIVQGEPPTWQGADLDRPVLLLPQTKYWLVWTMLPGSLIPATAQTTGSYLWAYASDPWTRSTVSYKWKFRLFCGLLDEKNVSVFGTGCADSSGSTGGHFTNRQPSIGNAAWRLEGASFPLGAPGLLLLGGNRNVLSLDLTTWGAPGCFLHTDIVLVAVGVTGTEVPGRSGVPAGHIGFPLPLPANAGLRGLFLGSQLSVLDAGSTRRLKFVFSNGLRTIVF